MNPLRSAFCCYDECTGSDLKIELKTSSRKIRKSRDFGNRREFR